MNVLYLLLPAALLLVIVFVLFFLWANKRRQFDDLDTPAKKMLLDTGSIQPQDRSRTTPTSDRPTNHAETK